MTTRPVLLLVSAILAIVSLAGIVFTWAPQLGLGRTVPIAPVLPARNTVMLAAVAVAVVIALTMAIVRRGKLFALVAVVVFMALGAANFAVIASHGTRLQQPAAQSEGTLRLFEWNTNGELVTPIGIAESAARSRPDFIVLPEVESVAAAHAIRASLAQDGQPFVLFMASGSRAQVAVLIRSALAGSYHAVAGPNRFKTLALTSDSGPTILALHAEKPLPGGSAGWRRELEWVASMCTANARVIVSGDFNGSVDNFGGDRLGGCIDSASAAGSASVGTWPTSLPPALGMPLDHTLVSPRAGTTLSWTALTAEDSSGARHRPTLTVIRQ